MFEFLQYAFMQRSFVAGILIAVVCSVIGNFLVMRRMALIGDGLAHIAFGGLTIGLALRLYPLWTALGIAVVSVIIINEVRSRAKLYGETAIGVLFSAGLAIGAVMLSKTKGLSVDVFSYLFGSLLTVTSQDIYIILGLGVLILLIIGILYKELLFIAFDEESATASGIPVKILDIILLSATAVTVVISMQVVGILLVSSLIFIPTVTALQFANGFKKTLVYSIFASVASVIVGLIGSYYLDAAAGGMIVLTSICFFVVAALLKNFVKSFSRVKNP